MFFIQPLDIGYINMPPELTNPVHETPHASIGSLLLVAARLIDEATSAREPDALETCPPSSSEIVQRTSGIHMLTALTTKVVTCPVRFTSVLIQSPFLDLRQNL